MMHTTENATPPRRTVIHFDLAALLSSDELAAFEAEAQKANARDLTEHFLNITIRKPEKAA